MKALLPIFFSVFLAELGDKTQLATMGFAADQECSKWGVFLAASAALVLSTLIAVLVGDQMAKYINPKWVKTAAGAMFIVIGIWVLYDGLRMT
jgi:putative Ca2+/H+ antiporter (TMEM165/GDT1 family)